ncbi:MAG: hypothetical protein IJQ12_04135 [Lachnospiraceae bacterium]|nr:hypothetical protein [Lachnospiraceae bacterium]
MLLEIRHLQKTFGSLAVLKDRSCRMRFFFVLNAMKEDGTLLAILEAHGMLDNFIGTEEGRTENP